MKINYQNGVLTSNDGKDKNAEIKVKGGVFYSIAKRTFDIVSSFLMLVVFSPLILILLLVKFLEDGKNPVYTSVRVGKGGKRFKFHKIRSMVVGAEDMKDKLIVQGKNEADGPVFKMKDDPRITKFGRFLRRSSLDEILQLWDILIGNLSVVGPRSPLPEEVKKYTPYEMHRLDVKGGLLCLWQIQPNRHSIKFDEWVKLDIEYIENRSIWLDLKIIFKGAVMVIFDHSGD
ncbi:MAG: sugar transferase [Clostridia bacterium]|nr:sugar transferase [Clostridia bacterium]